MLSFRSSAVLGVLLAAGLFIAGSSVSVKAQTAPAFDQPASGIGATATQPRAGGNNQRIIRPMIAVDPMTLQAEGRQIRLWGIRTARASETALEIRALDMMDRLIGAEPVDCKVMIWSIQQPVARCMSQSNQDIALVLLENGFAVVDRAQTYGSVFANGYAKAQEDARLHKRGIWRFVAEAEQESFLPEWMDPWLPTLVPLSLILGPLIGFVIVAWVSRRGLAEIADMHQREYAYSRKKEATLETRERMVLLTSLQAELEENMAKIEAFLTIYREMVKDLKTPGHQPKYQEGGDLLHQNPALQRTVFDTSVDRLSLLDLKLAGEIAKLYSVITSNPQFVTMDPTLPLPEAIKMIEEVIDNAEQLKPSIQKVIADIDAAASQRGPVLPV